MPESDLSLVRLTVQRKSWLYLVGLNEVHEVRKLINDPHVPTEEMMKELKRFNAPIIASTGE